MSGKHSKDQPPTHQQVARQIAEVRAQTTDLTERNVAGTLQNREGRRGHGR